MDPFTTMLLAGVAVIACVGGLLFALFAGSFEAEARQKKRKAMIDGGGAAASRIRGANKGQTAQAAALQRIREMQQRERKRNGFFAVAGRLEQADMKIKPVSFLLIFYVIAAVKFAALLLIGQPPLVAAPAAIVTAFGLPQIVLKKMISRRQAKFVSHFANAIDIMVRGVKSGLPINECLRVIANEQPEPVRGEFQRLVDSFSVGVSFEDGLQKMFNRMPLPEVNFFVTVLIIQRQTGGNLADALSNLSGILRGRKKMKGKITALSSEARASAIIIGCLPFVVGTMVYLMSPDYLMPLFTESQGNLMLGGALIWMSLGVLMMRSMTKFEI
ncbi:MAG: type II secretion system F family protein [Pseudomonadota bacterium]